MVSRWSPTSAKPSLKPISQHDVNSPIYDPVTINDVNVANVSNSNTISQEWSDNAHTSPSSGLRRSARCSIPHLRLTYEHVYIDDEQDMAPMSSSIVDVLALSVERILKDTIPKNGRPQ